MFILLVRHKYLQTILILNKKCFDWYNLIIFHCGTHLIKLPFLNILKLQVCTLKRFQIEPHWLFQDKPVHSFARDLAVWGSNEGQSRPRLSPTTWSQPLTYSPLSSRNNLNWQKRKSCLAVKLTSQYFLFVGKVSPVCVRSELSEPFRGHGTQPKKKKTSRGNQYHICSRFTRTQ